MRVQTLSVPRILKLDTWPLRLGLVLAGLFAWVQAAAPGLVGNDGYYHVKMASLMRSGLGLKFVWLPLTILNPARYVDHHWLFHILLMPFTGGDLVVGGRIASVVFAAAALFVAGWLLKSQNVRGAILWSVLIFAASSAFVYRMSMPRAQSLSLLWILLAVYLLLRRQDRWLVPLGITYVWLYDAFPLLLVVVGVYFIAARLTQGGWRWEPLAYAALGISLGLIINPYFPHNLTFIYHHLIAKLDLTNVPVGNEWFPYTTAQLLSNSGLALLAFVGGAFALGWNRQRISLPTAFLFGLSLVFGLMLMLSRRFVEYFPAFAVMFCAFACQPILSGRTFRWQMATTAVAAVSLAATLTARDARAIVADSTSAGQFAGASQWLAAHTPEGSLIFQTDWDDFTRLFFYNDHNVYTIGLDPTYLQRADPARYFLWVDITQGRGLSLSDAIRENFGAGYVVSDLKHRAFLARAADDPQLEEAYRDDNSVVFEVLDR